MPTVADLESRIRQLEARMTEAEDERAIRELLARCEADDPMNGCAFNAKANRFGARLRAVFGSDIGHWDVTDVGHVVTEAYGQVERGLLTKEDFRDFTFANPVRLHAGMDPDFFRGTPVESAAVRVLESGDASPAS